MVALPATSDVDDPHVRARHNLALATFPHYADIVVPHQIAEDIQISDPPYGENLKIELRLEPDLGLVKIDPAQAQQVILNLILNACDALTHSGHIVVETSNCKFQTVTGSMPRRGAATAPSPAFFLSSPTTVAAWTRNTSAPLRAFFHHQECWPRYRPGTYHSPRHCYHKPGIDSHRKRTWPWDAGHDPAATSIPRILSANGRFHSVALTNATSRSQKGIPYMTSAAVSPLIAQPQVLGANFLNLLIVDDERSIR